MERRTERRDDTRATVDAPASPPPTEVAHDRLWAQDLRSSIRWSAALLALLLVIDRGAGTLTPPRATLWVTLALLLYLVLHPTRVAAGEGWLSSRGLLRTRRVRTDQLVSVRCLDGVAQRLVLRDTSGASVEIDPRVLVANPPLWHRLDEDARASALRGSLTCGATALRRVSERIDRETAMTVFKVSGMDQGRIGAV
ncbi:hypothetical protein [Streptomyces sp. NBC_00038]|uniref:hypothetical protein n=1 Tax=Streptomyces sp. NBC_00038 TaxID=2903615 RepID=UPI002259066E|nr:hypothetical protein [Streptomyces sp. NBC_00038]MCX5559715.1 hypothetical protein [Streptomyces sp. NBC_00038]